jgi:hypothetical protein
MKVVLVQGLLKYLGDGEYNYSELYALAVSPLISLCDKSVSCSLIDKLIINKSSPMAFTGATLKAYPASVVSSVAVKMQLSGLSDPSNNSLVAVPLATSSTDTEICAKPVILPVVTCIKGKSPASDSKVILQPLRVVETEATLIEGRFSSAAFTSNAGACTDISSDSSF